jgi:hypothetical protein
MKAYDRLTLICSLLWPMTLLTAQDASAQTLKLNTIRFCDQFSGRDAGVKIAACITSLPSSGGTADARGFEGTQTIASNIFSGVTKPLVLWFGSTTYTVDTSLTVPSNVTLVFSQGSILSINSGVTLTISGGIEAPLLQIFGGYGVVRLSSNRMGQIYPQWFGAKGDGTTDDTNAFQKSINFSAGHTLFVSSGTYVITAPLRHTTAGNQPALRLLGAGMRKTVFDSRVANGALFSLDGSTTPSAYAYGANLSDFSIIASTSASSSRGIDLRSQWFARIERVRIQGLTGDGIRIINDNGDADATAYLTIDACHISGNGGWGIRTLTPPMGTPTQVSGTSFITVSACHITANTSGGIWAIGYGWRLIASSISSNLGPGLSVPHNVNGAIGFTSQFFEVSGCEFDGNAPFSIDFGAITTASITKSKFIVNAGNPAIVVRIGDGGTGIATGVYASGNTIRRDAGTATAFQLGSNAHYNRVEDSIYPTTTGVTKFSDTGLFNLLREDGKYIAPSLPHRQQTIASSYTPDISKATLHNILINSVGVFTLANPVNTGGVIAGGEELILLITNTSSGTVAITFGAGYATGGFANPGAGLTTTARFIYQPDSNRWMQVGAWSPAYRGLKE